MTVIGYARVNTTDQAVSSRKAALRAAWCDTVRAEKRSGTTRRGGKQLRSILEFLRSGDVLMVTSIDRLARSIGDLQDVVRSRMSAVTAARQADRRRLCRHGEDISRPRLAAPHGDGRRCRREGRLIFSRLWGATLGPVAGRRQQCRDVVTAPGEAWSNRRAQ
jgi:hypothetical protein